MGKLTEEQEKQLYKLLSQTPHDAAKWDALAKSGAEDKAIRLTLHDMLGAQGRHGSAGSSIICIKNRPSLALWFGNHGVGVPTVKDADLLQDIRSVFSILTPERKAEIAKAFESGPVGVSQVLTAASPQIPLFDYEQLDAETAGEVQDHAAKVKLLLGTMQLDAVEVGERLRAVKQHLGRGQFDGWLSAEFRMSRDTADKFIGSVVFLEGHPELKNQLSQFDRSAIYVLAAPSTPEPAVQEATARAQAGEKITPTKAREIKKRHAPATSVTPRIVKTKTPEPGIATAQDEVEAAWNRATILIQVKMMPHDGHERGRPIQIHIRNDNDKPVQFFTLHGNEGENTLRSDDLPPFKGQVGEALKQLYAEMPERIARAAARLKAEKAKKAKAKKATPAPKGKKRSTR